MEKFLKIRPILFLCLSLPLISEATDYAFVIFNPPWDTDYSIVKPHEHWHFEGDFRKVGKADFVGESRHSHVYYTDAFASAYYTHFIGNTNALAAQVGYSYLRFDWNKNPRFEQKDFHLGILSLSWISTTMDRWRWVLNGGTSFNLETLNFPESAVYYGMMWGRYQYNKWVGLHLGVFGYAGVESGFALPILGADFRPSDKWVINAIFPLDFSVEYLFAKEWSTSICYTSFGGPYRYPYRVNGGDGKYPKAVFEVFAQGVEWDLDYKYKTFVTASVGIGWNFGGWIFIKNRHGSHGRYFSFDGAPDVQANAGFTF